MLIQHIYVYKLHSENCFFNLSKAHVDFILIAFKNN